MALRSPLFNIIDKAARRAARSLLKDFDEVDRLNITRKGPADFVSQADKNAERLIIEELQKARPNYSFLAEETGETVGKDTSNCWIIDPLDGTTNFLHGLPHFAISIALERDGQLHAGMIYDPVKDEMFYAEKGSGAYLNDRRLRIPAKRSIDQAIFATGIPFYGHGDHGLFAAQLRQVMAVSAGVRRFGAAALDLAYVAAGRYDGYWEKNINAWDMAAGVLIVKEAGGFVRDYQDGNDMLKRGEVICGNDHMLKALQTLLAKAKK